MRIFIKTLGCRANRYESDKLFDYLKKQHEVFEKEVPSDIFIVNTCTVTHIADRKSRQAIRSYRRANPTCMVIVYGCGAKVAKDEYAAIAEVDEVFGTFEDVVAYIDKMGREHKELSCVEQGGERTRALVKIQDGCENYCSYCIVPLARGKEVSYQSADILREVEEKVARGFKEIVLTGINIGKWKEGQKDIADLIEFLLESVSDVRFRISSIVPKKFSAKFFELFKNDRLCPHVHLSLQSGSDDVLKRMKRGYDSEFFMKICDRLREAAPDIGLTTDVIVGFPGETDAEFSETCKFVQKVGFSKIHVFPYSKRKNTAASHMKDQVDDRVKRERAEKLRGISEELGRKFMQSQVGCEFEVIVEKCKDGVCTGITPNYIGVQFLCSKKARVGEIFKVKLVKILENGFVEAAL